MRLLAAFSTLVAAVALAAPAALADHGPNRHGRSLVFVQTNEPGGNRIAVFDRGADGRLTAAGTYATGGLGGVAAPGTESDHLASQGSLVYTREHSLLLAVNAGSGSVSVFRVRGSALRLTDVVSSGGRFPASIAVQDDLVYVLNAGGPGGVQGFRLHGARLDPIPGSARTLGLANTDPPNFLTSPGQVGFTPDGRGLIVTTKASGSTIDVFAVRNDGTLSAAPVANPSATPVPFAFTFDPFGRLVSGEAGASSVTTYTIGGNGTLSGPQSLTDGQAALCWIVRAGAFTYVSNTGSNNLSAYRIGADGTPALVGGTDVAAVTDAGPIDLTVAGPGFLYAQTGLAGTVDEFRINPDGTLTKLGAVTGLPPGQEGIAST